MPQAKPVLKRDGSGDILEFKGEPVYLRKFVTELHTPETWLRNRREVKKGELPVKKVAGMYNDKTRLAELYGPWQTKLFKMTLTADGHIPKNKYGNIETFNGPLPPECCHCNVVRAIPLSKKIGIEHVPAVIGFDTTGSYKGSYPVIRGVVIFKTDEKKLIEESQKWEEE